MDSSSNDLISHIIISKNFRECKRMIFKLKDNISDDHLLKNISNMVQTNNEYFISYIAGLKRENKDEIIENEEKFYIIDVTFVVIYIPKNLIQQLINNKLIKCIFYIGNFDEKEKFLIKSILPDEKEINLVDEKGLKMPYKTEVLNFDIIDN